MSIFFIKPYTLLFFSTLILGLLISLSSTNWLIIWIGLELTLYSFIPILLQTSFNQEKEAAIKYFLTQALASGLLLLGILISNTSNYFIICVLFALCIKLGLAPFHFWLPSIIVCIPWLMCWILSTILKVAPILLLILLIDPSSHSIIASISAISVIVGGIGGLNQTQIRPLLAYSSIRHIGWTMACAMVSPSFAIFYFSAYILIVSSIIIILNNISSFTSTSSLNILHTPKLFQLTFIISILCLAGLPPLFGFFPKLIVLNLLIQRNIFLLAIFLIIGATINIFYYLKLLTSLFFAPSSTSPILLLTNYSNLFTPLISSLASISAIILISIFIF